MSILNAHKMLKSANTKVYKPSVQRLFTASDARSSLHVKMSCGRVWMVARIEEMHVLMKKLEITKTVRPMPACS